MSKNKLNDQILKAQERLNEVFGSNEGRGGNSSYKFLNQKSLSEAYKIDTSTNEIIIQFMDIIKSIRAMRSSYLPVTFYINSEESNRFQVDIASDFANIEPYENTFLRMIGMPSVTTYEFSPTIQDSEIKSLEKLITINPLDGKVEYKNFKDIRDSVLRERKLPKSSRRIKIDNNIYNIFSDNTALSDKSIRSLNNRQKSELLGLPYISESDTILDLDGNPVPFYIDSLSVNEEDTAYINPITFDTIDKESVDKAIEMAGNQSEDKILDAKIDAIEDDLWKFCYLYFPPIQDADISNSINEPSKIVAPPFSSSRGRKINDNEVRPTLLEAIIRIRLDKVSGTDTFFGIPEQGRRGVFKEKLGNLKSDTEVSTDSYGILESLFILRLRSAISGLAQKLYDDIDDVIDGLSKSRRTVTDQGEDDGTNSENIRINKSSQNENTSIRTRDLSNLDKAGLPVNDINEIKSASLSDQKLIEDSIMFLLGDNSEVLDFQSGTQRSSGIKNAHMMGGLVNIVDVPRKRIIEQQRNIQKSRFNESKLVVDKGAQRINVTLGTDIGIGTIDVAVFSLALFAISENSLLGLLNDKQFEKIKSGEFQGLLPESAERQNSVKAINELSELLIDGYNLFISELKNGGIL